MLRTFFVVFVTLWTAAAASASDAAFPRPADLEPDVRFWTRVYTEVGTDGGLLHDTRDLGIVYEVVQLPPHARSGRAQERYTEGLKRHYRDVLLQLSRGPRQDLGAEEARVLALFPDGVTDQTLRTAASNVRFQLGQANKFRAGVIRSGAYVEHIRETLHEMGLPEEIAALPHVESSFTPTAYSRVGAAGLWQFTRSTGRRYMRVDHVVDERLDPHVASVAAARLLEHNYRVTGSWPLAITAYNHGAAGMRRAIRQLGTRDITTIVRQYRSRSFGFASRNFYVEFLAASAIAADPDRYFGGLVPDPPLDLERVELPFHTSPAALARTLGVGIDVLKETNPALRPSVWQGAKHVPRGYTLAVPRALLARPLALALADVPEDERHARQTRDLYHTVRRGETLSSIASQYGLRISQLEAMNGLASRHRIRVGQKLRLPGEHDSGQQLVAVSATQSPPPEPPPTNGFYTVARGDSLWSIARRFEMSEEDLAVANGLSNRDRIAVGQTLRIAMPEAVPTSAEVGATEVASDVEVRAEADAGPAAEAGSEADRSLDGETAPTREPAALAELAEPPPARLAASEGPEIGPIAEVAAEAGAEFASESTDLIADPADYTVAADSTVEVQANETLGHYAEWLEIRTNRLRSLNHLSYGESLAVHSRLQLDFTRVDPETFERRRLAHHQAIQEDFFERFEITGTEVHRMRRGDSVWVLSHRKYNVPLWLLRQYNPDLDFEALSTGTEITVPQLRPRDLEAEGATLGSTRTDASTS